MRVVLACSPLMLLAGYSHYQSRNRPSSSRNIVQAASSSSIRWLAPGSDTYRAFGIPAAICRPLLGRHCLVAVTVDHQGRRRDPGEERPNVHVVVALHQPRGVFR